MSECTCSERGWCPLLGIHTTEQLRRVCRNNHENVKRIPTAIIESRVKQPVKADKPIPRWVRLLQRLSTPDDIGLGATAKRLASKFGGERFKKLTKKLGMPCKCGDREKEWNRIYPNPNYRENQSE